MTRFENFSVLLALIVLAVLLSPKGLAYPADDILDGDLDPNAYPVPGVSHFEQMPTPQYNRHAQTPRGCFHFYVSQNMSSLLSDATKMLQQVHDRREREWILTFIYRIKSLAEHLRTHPESKNYDCLQGEDDIRRHDSLLSDHLRIPQQELYFVDDMQPNNQKRGSASPPDQAKEVEEHQPTANVQTESNVNQQENVANQHDHEQASELTKRQDSDAKELTQLDTSGMFDKGIVISSPPDCNARAECERALDEQERLGIDHSQSYNDDLVQQVVQTKQQLKNMEEERMQQQVLKKRIRTALLEEMAPEVKKLRTVGGSEEDLINLWKLSESSDSNKLSNFIPYSDFDYEENGAAAGDLSTNDRYTTSGRTVAPSTGEMKNFKRQSNNAGSTKAYEPYDDGDVLVRQLFDIRYEAKEDKSASDPKEEYLIRSTQVPY